MRGGVSESFRLHLLLVVFILFLCKYESPCLFSVLCILVSLIISWMICEYILEIYQILLKIPAGCDKDSCFKLVFGEIGDLVVA